MCNNACVYNLPETVYYKAAKKLLYQGQKLLSQEKIQSMKSQAPYVKQIAEAELGFDIIADENNLGKLTVLYCSANIPNLCFFLLWSNIMTASVHNFRAM
jgi:hypothetical protein